MTTSTPAAVQASTSTGSKPAPLEETISRFGVALQQIRVGMKMPRQFVARRADLVGMRRRQDRREDIRRALVLEPVEPHVGPRLQDLGIDVVGEIFDVKDALVVDGHFVSDFRLEKSELQDAKVRSILP